MWYMTGFRTLMQVMMLEALMAIPIRCGTHTMS